MSPPLPQNPPPEGELELERQYRKKFVSDLKDFLLWRDPDATLSSLIDDFVVYSDGVDTNTHIQEVMEKPITLLPSAGNLNFTKKDPIPPAVAVVEEKILNEDDETEEPMHLLILNGCEICVVDIKQRKRFPRGKVEYLEKIATLNLAEEQLPVSVGLFRLGSDVYMIGGHSFPADTDDDEDIDPDTDEEEDIDPNPNPFMYETYRHFVERGHVKGTSSDTYCLSIANNGTLSPSKRNNILKLQTPKLWPVVADIKGKLHVFDSFPGSFSHAGNDWIFSHEVIGKESRLSLTIEPTLRDFIKSHLVLGDNIFALADRHMCLLFDSIKLEWNSDSGRCDGSSTKNVWDILFRGREAMCVEEIMVGNVSYYLVLALLNEWEDVDVEVFVMAYLVTSKGDIVGRQTLHSFFRGPIQPLFARNDAIIKGGGTDGRTMCIAFTSEAIINGIRLPFNHSHFFFSHTFTVELVNNYASNIQRMLESGPANEIAIDGELVRIHIKDRCVYKLNENDDGLAHSVGMEACFF